MQQQLGPNYFVAGLTEDFLTFMVAPEVAGRQRQANWCWAACVQMALNAHGVRVTMEQVVERIFGWLVDRPGTPSMIMHALSGWGWDLRGRPCSIHADPYIPSHADAVQCLAGDCPLIVGLNAPDGGVGHAYLLTAVYFVIRPGFGPEICQVVLRDPWPGNPSRQELSYPDFWGRHSFATKVYVLHR